MALNNLLANMARVGIRTAIRATATVVTIQRGAASSEPKTVGRGKTVYQFVSAGDAFTSEDVREDFIVWPSDYDLGSGPVEPADGDRIIVDDGSTIATYEVNAPQPEPAYRYTDRFRTAWRIHAVLIDQQPSE